jgi:hypothetical protein
MKYAKLCFKALILLLLTALYYSHAQQRITHIWVRESRQFLTSVEMGRN